MNVHPEVWNRQQFVERIPENLSWLPKVVLALWCLKVVWKECGVGSEGHGRLWDRCYFHPLHSSTLLVCFPSKCIQLSTVTFASWFALSSSQDKGSRIFSYKGPGTILGFLDHTVCVVAPHLCYCRGEEPQTVCKQKTVAVCSNKTLFTKMGGGPHPVHEP